MLQIGVETFRTELNILYIMEEHLVLRLLKAAVAHRISYETASTSSDV